MMETEFCLKSKCKSPPPKLIFRPYKHYTLKLEKKEFALEQAKDSKNKWQLKLKLPDGEYRYQIVCDGEVRIDYTLDVDIDEKEELCNKLIVGKVEETPTLSDKIKYEELSPMASPIINALLLEGANKPPKSISNKKAKKKLENEMAALEEQKKKEH